MKINLWVHENISIFYLHALMLQTQMLFKPPSEEYVRSRGATFFSGPLMDQGNV